MKNQDKIIISLLVGMILGFIFIPLIGYSINLYSDEQEQLVIDKKSLTEFDF